MLHGLIDIVMEGMVKVNTSRIVTKLLMMGCLILILASLGVAANDSELVNLALPKNGGMVTSSSSFSGYFALAVVNDQLNDISEAGRWEHAAWASAEREEEHWLEFTIAEGSEVGGVSIYWARDRDRFWMSSNYVVEYWDEEQEEWVMIFEYITDKEILNVYSTEITFVPVKTSKIRLLQREGGGSVARPNLMWIAEVQIWGK